MRKTARFVVPLLEGGSTYPGHWALGLPSGKPAVNAITGPASGTYFITDANIVATGAYRRQSGGGATRVLRISAAPSRGSSGEVAQLRSELDSLKRRIAVLEEERSRQDTADGAAERAVRDFANRVRSQAGVEGVYWRRSAQSILVWTVIPRMDLALQDILYAAELRTVRQFQTLPLEFRTIFRGEEDRDSVVPPGAVPALPASI